MTLALVSAFAVDALNAMRAEEHARRVPTIVDVSNDLYAAIQNLRLERGNVGTALGTPGVPSPEIVAENLMLRDKSEAALNSAFTRLATISIGDSEPAITGIREARSVLKDTRATVDAALQKPQNERPDDLRPRWVEAQIKIADAIVELATKLELDLSQGDPFVSEMVRIKQIAWSVRADAGRDRFRIGQILASGTHISQDEQLQFAVLMGRIDGTWKLVQDEVVLGNMPQELGQAVEEANRLYFTGYRNTRNTIFQDLAAGRTPAIDARAWMSDATPGQQALFAVGSIALDLAKSYGLQQHMAAEAAFSGAIALMIVFSAIGALTSWYVFIGVVQPITKITEAMNSVASGNLACAVPYEGRVDEIGSLAHGLRVFRDNAIEKQRLRIEKDGAQAASRAKSEFLANISHELRTPLNAIIGFSEVIKTQMFGPLSDRYRNYAGDIFNSGNHLLGLINEILDLSKLEAGQVELHEETVDLAATVEACLNLVETQAEHANIRLSSALDRTAPMIRADDRRLRQILINLLSNAVKFTPGSGEVCVTSVRKHGGLAIAVSDTGIGIAPEDIPKAMTPFGQVDSKISRQHEGTGLGLPLAKHLIELHGGSLSIDSAVNVGTTVTIIIPAQRIVAVAAPRAAAG
jgi:signal transduction histidine kinase